MPVVCGAKPQNCGVPVLESPSASRRNAAFISDEYLSVLHQWHRERPGHQGRSGFKYVDDLLPVIRQYEIKTVLDYGAGQCSLEPAIKNIWRNWKIAWTNYDPAHPDIAELPEGKFDLVVSTDVLEHVEPERLEAVLDNIHGYAQKYVFLQISCREAAAVMPDGRNAHLIVQEREWWIEKVQAHFPDFEMYVPETRRHHLFIHLKKNT
jgi:hypothetical protein